MKRLTHALCSVLLATMTLIAIRALILLPQSNLRDTVSDVLSFPGAFAAAVVFPGGVHGSSPAIWAWGAILCNLIFYSVLWYWLMRIAGGWQRRSRSDDRRG